MISFIVDVNTIIRFPVMLCAVVMDWFISVEWKEVSSITHKVKLFLVIKFYYAGPGLSDEPQTKQTLTMDTKHLTV